jgi:GTP cyclohydrolase I
MSQSEPECSDIFDINVAGIEDAVSKILRYIGEDTERDGLADTPRRVAQLYTEIFSGLRENPADFLSTLFEGDYYDPVLVSDIPFYSICEHHLLPFTGLAQVAYHPSGKVIGASKVPRIIDSISRRPQIQERLTSEIADIIHSGLNSQSTLVYMSAEHMCMAMRGVEKKGSKIVTFAQRGNKDLGLGLKDLMLLE